MSFTALLSSVRRGWRIGALALVLVAPSLGYAANAGTLYLFNWNEYLNPKIVKQFEAKYDVKVVQNYYSYNAQMISKLQAGGTSEYDIVVPSNYQMPKLIHQKLIRRLNQEQIPKMTA